MKLFQVRSIGLSELNRFFVLVESDRATEDGQNLFIIEKSGPGVGMNMNIGFVIMAPESEVNGIGGHWATIIQPQKQIK